MPIIRFPNGDLPARVYSKADNPVLLSSEERARSLRMLLITTDRPGSKPWHIGTNENGWWFCFRSQA